MPLERLTIYHLRSPLRSATTTDSSVWVDSFVALACFDDGSMRAGESTPRQAEESSAILREYRRLAADGQIGPFLDRNRCDPAVAAPILSCLDPPLRDAVTGSVRLCP